MSSIEDNCANKVFQELRQQIVSFIDVDEIIPLLYKKRWLTLYRLQCLENPRSGLTDTERKQYLVNHSLMDKGFSALQMFLDVLDETSKSYEPHEKLSVILRQQYQNVFDQMSQEALGSITDHSTISDSFQQSTMPADHITASMSSMPDIVEDIGQIFSRITKTIAAATPPTESTSISHHRSHRAASAPAFNYIVAITHTSGSSQYHSTSLNTDPGDYRGINSSKDSPPLFAPIEETTGGNCKMEETLHCDNKGKPKECSILQHSVSQSESYYEPPTMFATESHNETASVEHEERREAAHCSVSTTTEDNDIHTNTCLSEYDVISSLQLSTDPLPNMLPMKLILLGSSGVGKTSLIMRFLQKCFWQAQTTIAVDHNHCFVSHLSKHVNISLTLFDTAGQERFDSICASYYRDADAVLMVFDMTDQDSLDDVGNRWVKQMKDHMSSTDIPVLLVGNKCECHLHISRGIRTQAKEMVRQFDFAEFMEASAKDGQKVEVIFEKILSLAVTRLLKLRGFTESENDNVITLDPPTFITPRRKCC